MARKSASDPDDKILTEAREAYARAQSWWSDNRKCAEEDMKFVFLDKQWPEAIEAKRKRQNRPCLTFNKIRPIIRQVINDARQNKPSIKVHPQDSNADPRVAEIIGDLIRNIEVTSDADIAYDTAITQAVGQGYGFWRINTRYTSDDAFDQDIVIERIANPFTVYGDPRSTAADSSDWDEAFVVTTMTKAEFKAAYPKAEKVNWDTDFHGITGWLEGDDVTVAEYWTREKVKRTIVQLSDGSVLDLDEYEAKEDEFSEAGLTLIGKPSERETHKVTLHKISGAEILETVEWPGKYIPIVPVYGDEVVDKDGKRHYWSLTRGARSSQEQLNYWETTRTELIALAPKAPFIGEEQAFEIDPNWNTANDIQHPFLKVPNGVAIPQRQPFTGVAAGTLQEALNASDNIKATTGIYDASLGARSNETSGVAIRNRQMEGDTSTFHFIDNLSRAIRHCGRILIDLIPKVYTTERMIRVLGEDLAPRNVQIAPNGEAVTPIHGPPTPEELALAQQQNRAPQPSLIGHIFDITAGKYDLTVSAGPSYTSKREEVRATLTEAAQGGGPQVAAVLLPRIAKMMDIPDADEIAEELEYLNPAKQAMQQQQGLPPEVQQQMQQGMEMIQQLQAENAKLQQAVNDKMADRAIEAQKVQIDAARAQTERMKVAHEISQPTIFRGTPAANGF
jgi:hypothetical protein